jgi:hypothetical protein
LPSYVWNRTVVHGLLLQTIQRPATQQAYHSLIMYAHGKRLLQALYTSYGPSSDNVSSKVWAS